MTTERERECSACGEPKTFYRSASTRLHLGLKTKWRCSDCGHDIVLIDDDVDSEKTGAGA
jgi:predicted RNA-binding Zn-ribbon protein involved in translation (DUF1610 family)